MWIGAHPGRVRAQERHVGRRCATPSLCRIQAARGKTRLVLPGSLERSSRSRRRRAAPRAEWPHRFLPGAKEFLETVADHHVKVVAGDEFAPADARHQVGSHRYRRIFRWRVHLACTGRRQGGPAVLAGVEGQESFDPARTVFIDDNVAVLQSARDFGVELLLHVTRPDSRRDPSPHDEFVGIEGVGGAYLAGRLPRDRLRGGRLRLPGLPRGPGLRPFFGRGAGFFNSGNRSAS